MLPILDTSLVTITRLMRGQSPAQGGRDHTSHRLIAFGLSERQTLFVLYSVALAAGVMAAALEWLNYYLSLALAPLLMAALAILVAYLGGLKVVAASPTSDARRTVARWMQDLAYRRRVLEVGLDFIVIGLAYYMAFLARYALVMNAERFQIFLRTLPLAWAAAYLAFYVLGVYRGVWRYVGVSDLVRYVQAALGSSLMMLGIIFAAASLHLGDWFTHYSHLTLAWFAVFLLLGLAATRSSFKLLDSLAPKSSSPDEQNVLIYGAGDLGELALRWIILHPELHFRPVGFVDTNPTLRGRQIHGIEVFLEDVNLERLMTQKNIRGFIVTPDSEQNIDNLRQLCNRKGCWMQLLRLEFEKLA
jgi:UDP-GlcNAc:undecaprenyl-phosphate GlcNAc-1-phosphate transferase